MENPRQPSQEVRESGEKSEATEQQRLDDATFEPVSYVEKIGEYSQAESIQTTLVVLVEDAKAAEEAVSAVVPRKPGKADASAATESSGESGGGVEAIPINLPDVQSATEEGSSLPLPLPSPDASDAEEGSVLPLPLPSPSSLEPPSIRGDLDKAETKAGTPKGDEATPINLPDMQEVRAPGAEPGARIQDAAAAADDEKISATPITLPGQEKSATSVPLRAEREAVEGKPSAVGFKVERVPLEGDAVAGEQYIGTEEGLSGGEGTGEGGDWTPPDWYVTIGPDGKAIVVDADGHPVDSPPMVQTVDPSDGSPINPQVYYKGGSTPVELPYYSGSLEGCSVYIGPDGKATVVDADGKPLPAQPVIQTVNPADGSPCPPQAYYQGTGGNPVNLPYYTGPKPKTDSA